jgi:glycosyltransferase involved in cell wall biosynthesis
LKVLQVIDRLTAGGAERVFLDLTKLLLDKNIKVDTLTVSGKGVLYDLIDQRAERYYLDRKNKFSGIKLLECAELCAKYDIVHVHMRHTYKYIRLVQLVSRKKFKVIFHDHFGDIDKDVSIPLGFSCLLKPKYYIGVSLTLTNWAKNNLKVKSNNIWLLRNTILPNNNEFINVNNNKWIIVSNLKRTKNIEFAIDFALKHRVELDIYGQSIEVDYSKEVYEKIRSVKGVNLIANEFNIQTKLRDYKFAIHTAYSESGPLVILEYLIQGLPFLAHKTGEVADVLYSEIPQCFVDNLDELEWSKKLLFLNDNIPNEEKLKDLFNKHFGFENYINECVNIYQKVLDS